MAIHFLRISHTYDKYEKLSDKLFWYFMQTVIGLVPVNE